MILPVVVIDAADTTRRQYVIVASGVIGHLNASLSDAKTAEPSALSH